MKYNKTMPNRAYPKGATSLLIVVGLAMLLMVIVAGLTVLSVRESRQALNTDLSNRALAAATATARDSAQLLNTDPNLQVPDCSGANTVIKSSAITLSITDLEKPVLSNQSDNKTTIVCRTITSVATTFTQELGKDQSTQFITYAPNNTPIRSMKLYWGDGATDINSFIGTPFPSVWPSQTPAAMEVTLVYWRKTGGQPGSINTPTPDGLPVRTVVLLPRANSTDPSPINTTVSEVDCGGGKNGQNNRIYSCSSRLDLSSIIANATDYNIVVKLKPRYATITPIQVQFYTEASNEPVAVQSSIATIDITAKVGDLYRRIQAQKPVGSNSFIDDVLYSNAKICKNLSVLADFSLSGGGNSCPDSY